MTSSKNPNQEPKSNRRKLYKIHSWVGFHLALIMMIVLATGTLATVSHEIDWLIQKELRVTPGTEKVSLQTMADAVKEYAPNVSITTIQALEGDYLAYRTTVRDEYDKLYYIHVNQWTGEVTGETGRITVQRVLRDLHRHLFMPKQIGLLFVSSMAFILLISLYTGLKTSRNWKTLMTRVRRNKGARVMIGDAHKAAGLWSVWLIVLLAVTSIWYLAELGSEIAAFVKKNPELAFATTTPAINNNRLSDIGNLINTPSVGDITNAAETAFPEIKDRITALRFPTKPGKPIAVLGVRDNPLLRDRANQVYLDPESLDVIKVQRSEDISWVSWLNEIADPLHFGFFGGLITKLIWFIFGLAMTGLSVSGVYLTWKRLKSKSASRAQLATLPILLLASLFAYFYWYPLFKVPTKSHSEITYSKGKNKEFELELHIGINQQNKPDGKIRLLVKGDGGSVNIKNATIELQSRSTTLGSKQHKLKLRKLDEVSLYTRKLPPTTLTEADKVLISIELNTGDMITSSWPIDLNKLDQ